MPAAIRTLVVLFALIVTADLYSQVRFYKKNQFDTDGKKHGYWVETSRSDPGQKTFKGWYNHGKETRRCTYYNNGVKLAKFRYVNDSLMRIRRYYPDGKPEYKGSALWLTNNNEMRFCWDGEFVFYDQHRNVIRKATYIRGVELDYE